jgi:hypothetical protein
MATSTITLLDTIEWSKRFNFRRPIALGNGLEPALSNANIVLQTILGAPFAWRWNRVVTGFITTPGQQDYFLFNWQPSTPVQLGWLTVDTFGNSQVVTTAGTTDTAAPTWNATTGGTTTDGTAVWTNLGSINTPVSQTYNFGFIETSSIQSIVTLSPFVGKWIELTSQICLGLDSSITRPSKISAQADDGNGNITFRLMSVPDIAYPVAITIQQKPALFTKLSQTWGPIPDEYSRIYNWGFLALAWMFGDDPRFGMANQKFITQLLSVNEGLTETERNIFLGNWEMITGQPTFNQNRMSQGEQARGV